MIYLKIKKMFIKSNVFQHNYFGRLVSLDKALITHDTLVSSYKYMHMKLKMYSLKHSDNVNIV